MVRLLFCPACAPGRRPPPFRPVSDRLEELRQQRALVQQHLAWLDSEIARASAAMEAGSEEAAKALPSQPNDSDLPGAPTAASAGATKGAITDSVEGDPEAILANFRADASRAPQQVKLGCWLAFAGAFAVLGLFLLTWWFVRGR